MITARTTVPALAFEGDAGKVLATALHGFSVTQAIFEISLMMAGAHIEVAALCVAAVPQVREKIVTEKILKDYVATRETLRIVRTAGQGVSDSINFGALRLVGQVLITTANHVYLNKIIAKVGNPLTNISMGSSAKASEITSKNAPSLAPQWSAVLAKAAADPKFLAFMNEVATFGYLIGESLKYGDTDLDDNTDWGSMVIEPQLASLLNAKQSASGALVVTDATGGKPATSGSASGWLARIKNATLGSAKKEKKEKDKDDKKDDPDTVKVP
jgi:hypothetical protein